MRNDRGATWAKWVIVLILAIIGIVAMIFIFNAMCEQCLFELPEGGDGGVGGGTVPLPEGEEKTAEPNIGSIIGIVLVVGVVGGLAGWKLPAWNKKRKQKKKEKEGVSARPPRTSPTGAQAQTGFKSHHLPTAPANPSIQLEMPNYIQVNARADNTPIKDFVNLEYKVGNSTTIQIQKCKLHIMLPVLEYRRQLKGGKYSNKVEEFRPFKIIGKRVSTAKGAKEHVIVNLGKLSGHKQRRGSLKVDIDKQTRPARYPISGWVEEG